MKRIISLKKWFYLYAIFDKYKMHKSDILQTDINFIGEGNELTYCNN